MSELGDCYIETINDYARDEDKVAKAIEEAQVTGEIDPLKLSVMKETGLTIEIVHIYTGKGWAKFVNDDQPINIKLWEDE